MKKNKNTPINDIKNYKNQTILIEIKYNDSN